jgi:hypothetical protein
MNLAQAIHTRWAADTVLNGLLPVTQVMTGIYVAGEPGSRYATVALCGGRFEGAANDGSSIDTVTIRIQVHHDDYDTGRSIADAVLASFDRSSFSLSPTDKVICMQRTGLPTETQDAASRRWSWAIDFQCRVSLAGTDTTET